MHKSCFKCGAVKPLTDFYKHKGMADGHVNKCKECNKRDVTENRKENVDYYRAYDRKRGSRQDGDYVTEYRSRYPKKYTATNAVNNAVRDGKLQPKPCEVCGKVRAVAHHDDYNKPLEVRWLCQAHHMQWHEENGPGLNGE